MYYLIINTLYNSWTWYNKSRHQRLFNYYVTICVIIVNMTLLLKCCKYILLTLQVYVNSGLTLDHQISHQSTCSHSHCKYSSINSLSLSSEACLSSSWSWPRTQPKPRNPSLLHGARDGTLTSNLLLGSACQSEQCKKHSCRMSRSTFPQEGGMCNRTTFRIMTLSFTICPIGNCL